MHHEEGFDDWQELLDNPCSGLEKRPAPYFLQKRRCISIPC